MAVEAAASVMAGSVLAAALDLESGESFTSTTDIQLEMPNFRRSHRASAPAAEGGSNAEALGSAANLEPHSPMRPRPRLALSPSRLSRETSTSSPRDVGNPPNTSRNRRNSHVESSSAQANASDEGRRTGGRRSWTRGSVVSAPPPGVSLDLGTKRKKRVSFSIALQLTLFVAVLVVVSSGSMALVLWLNSQTVIDREIERRLTTVVTLRQQEVLHYFASESDNLNLIATRVLINALLLRHNAGDTLGSSDVQVGTNDLRTAVSVLPDVRSIAIYDANRTLLLNSSNLSPADPNLADVSPFSLPVNSSRGLVLAANAPIMFPIGGGVVIGYVHAVLDAGKFQALVSDGVGLQRTGEVLLGAVDPGTDALRLVLPPSRDPLAPPVQTWQPDRALEKAIMNQTGFQNEEDYRGKVVAAAYAPLGILGWGIVAKIDASEAYGAIHHMRTIILATVPCVLALGICASYLLSRIFTAPITKLDKVARALADGDLSARAKGASWEMHDEIGGLRDTFNEMADQMAKLYSTLESRIEERTRDLMWANADLAAEIESRQSAQAELVKAKDEAVSANKIKSNFLANMSHEIRTPLNGIINCTELCLETHIDAEQQEYLELVKFSAEHLLNVINDILDFSKIEAEKMELERVGFSLRDQLEAATTVLAVRACRRNVEIIVDVRPDVPDNLMGDPGRLFQILVNLIGNAVKFTPAPGVDQGEVLVSIIRESISGDGQQIQLKFSIKDTGIGIPLEKQSLLFRPFSQVDSSTTRVYGGTGLGLVISAKLAASMGGSMWVESHEGQGSNFLFTAAFQLSDTPPAKRSAAMLEALQSLPVLIVDDNVTSGRILGGMTASWGMSPTVVTSGPAGIEALHAAAKAGRAFRLVLADVCMPGMGGLDMVADVREKTPVLLAKTAVVGLTLALSAAEHAERMRELMVQGHCAKPIKEDSLLRAVHAAIGQTGSTGLTPPARKAPRGSPLRGSLHVLVAEDNAVNQKVATALLTKWGHTLKLANNGREAVDMIDKEPFDLILMDVQMPVMDGFAATAAIRAWELRVKRRPTPIVAMTAHAMSGDAERCLSLGMDAYISKPLNAEKLHSMIKEMARARLDQAEAAALVSPMALLTPTGLLQREATRTRRSQSPGPPRSRVSPRDVVRKLRKASLDEKLLSRQRRSEPGAPAIAEVADLETGGCPPKPRSMSS